MIEIKSPKNSTNKAGDDPSKSSTYVIPENLSTDAYNKIYAEILNKVVEKEDELEARILRNEKEVEKQTSRGVEIIGIFSAVLALLIGDVSIIKSVTSFLSAILLTTALAAVMATFAILIHVLFVPDDKKRMTSKSLWMPIIILILFIILGIIAEYYKWSWA